MSLVSVGNRAVKEMDGAPPIADQVDSAADKGTLEMDAMEPWVAKIIIGALLMKKVKFFFKVTLVC